MKEMEGILQFYELLSKINDLGIDEVDQMTSTLLVTLREVRSCIERRYPVIVEKFGRDIVEQVVGTNFSRKLEEEYETHLKAKKQMASYRSGVVLEAAIPTTSSSMKDENGYYPVDLLLQGVQWPADVDAAKRESYLSPDNFHGIFGMSKEDFARLSKYERIQLKKQHRLF